MKIREMTLDDLPQVMQIENSSFSVPWTENGFFSFLIREDALFLVAEEEGVIYGYCGLILIPPEGEITNVAVSGEARGRGIGRMLITEQQKQAAARGIRKIYLEVRETNAAAIALYSHHGYEMFGRRKNYYSEPKEDALVMCWEV